MARILLPLLSALGALSLCSGQRRSAPLRRGPVRCGEAHDDHGHVSKVDWINPHVYIYMDVADEKGAVTTWRLESLPTAMLRKAGLTSEMIKGGGQKVTAAATHGAQRHAEFGVAAEPQLRRRPRVRTRRRMTEQSDA